MVIKMLNDVIIIDNALTDEQCDQLISEGSKNLDSQFLETPLGYNYSDFELDHPIIEELTFNLVNEYSEKCPAINMTDTTWEPTIWRFKHFPPSYAFSNWHQEHIHRLPYRIACMLVYLSDHESGTEFYNGDVVQSKKGRAMIFPTFWTHTHRGQVCPEGKDRYIMSMYLWLTDIQK
jgi:hypothetical protein